MFGNNVAAAPLGAAAEPRRRAGGGKSEPEAGSSVTAGRGRARQLSPKTARGFGCQPPCSSRSRCLSEQLEPLPFLRS